MDFFTAEVLTWSGLATYYVLFFIHLETRRVTIAGVTRHPAEPWMEQMARNATDESTGCLRELRYVLHDRDTKFCASFRLILRAGGVEPVKLPARSPDLKDYASHCTSFVLADATLIAARRSDNLWPWALGGGLSPGCSYRQAFRSL